MKRIKSKKKKKLFSFPINFMTIILNIYYNLHISAGLFRHWRVENAEKGKKAGKNPGVLATCRCQPAPLTTERGRGRGTK